MRKRSTGSIAIPNPNGVKKVLRCITKVRNSSSYLFVH